MGFGFGDKAVIGFPDHPTLLEIAERQKEIDRWDLLDTSVRRRNAKWICLGGNVLSPTALIVAWWPSIPPHWPWDLFLALVAVMMFAVAMIAALVWHEDPNHGRKRPEPLEVVPFSAAENLVLMSDQQEEVFFPACACPGCGDVLVHKMRISHKGVEPLWAQVIRHCDTCQREWAES